MAYTNSAFKELKKKKMIILILQNEKPKCVETPEAAFDKLSLTIILRMTPIGVFPDYFSFNHFSATSCCF